jgi:hypothetical protein
MVTTFPVLKRRFTLLISFFDRFASTSALAFASATTLFRKVAF